MATGNDGWSLATGSHHDLVCFLPSWSSQVTTLLPLASWRNNNASRVHLLFKGRAACLTHDDYSLADERGRADGEKPGAHQLQKDTNVAVACREPPTCRPMRPGRRRRSHAEPGVNRAAADRMHCVPQPRRHTPSLAGALSPRVSSQ